MGIKSSFLGRNFHFGFSEESFSGISISHRLRLHDNTTTLDPNNSNIAFSPEVYKHIPLGRKKRNTKLRPIALL